eukprot:COSAG05_NODE_1131_length_5775_cov_33.399930_6_plen_37_part_00
MLIVCSVLPSPCVATVETLVLDWQRLHEAGESGRIV